MEATDLIDVLVTQTGEIIKIPAMYSFSPLMAPMPKNRLQIASDALAYLQKWEGGSTDKTIMFQLEEWDSRIVNGVIQTGRRMNTIYYDENSFFIDLEMERLAG